jgi:putative tryptophan/tyrosine transport system substrate-binding protein
MKRRDFIAGLGAAAAWPFVAGAQQTQRIPIVGFLMGGSASDRQTQAWKNAFVTTLRRLGYEEGRNIRYEFRFAAGQASRYPGAAVELLGLSPDVIVSETTPAVAALQRATNTVPIVMVTISDPVKAGFVTSIAHPGGNITGFSYFEYSIGGKWLQLLRGTNLVDRVGVLWSQVDPAGPRYLAPIEAEARLLGLQLEMIAMRDGGEIERSIDAFAREPRGGLMVIPTAVPAQYRELIIRAAALHRLPAIYYARTYIEDGGLMCYGVDIVDQHRSAAIYVDRILKGEKPAELPVQLPTKYEFVINLETAKTIDLALPPTLLAIADEVIE